VVGWPAKIAVVASALAPNAVAFAMRIANALQPQPTDASGDRARSGWQSLSAWAPSRLTRLTDRAAVDHNQLATAPAGR
jgi:Spy/CpxP family protein refolding chaperone